MQEAELQHVMRACMDENGMKFDEESIEQLTGALYQVKQMLRWEHGSVTSRSYDPRTDKRDHR